jgi:hypothetical protein
MSQVERGKKKYYTNGDFENQIELIKRYKVLSF